MFTAFENRLLAKMTSGSQRGSFAIRTGNLTAYRAEMRSKLGFTRVYKSTPFASLY